MSFNTYIVLRHKNHINTTQSTHVNEIWLLKFFCSFEYFSFLFMSLFFAVYTRIYKKKKKLSSVRIQPAGPGLGAGWMYWGHTKTFLDVSQAFFPNPLTTEVVPSAASQHNQHANMSPRVSVDFTSPCEETKTRSWKRSKATQQA